jgi:hypothetical protein
VPPFPVPGQKVVFLASVKNQGSLATVAGTPLKAKFSVNGQQVSWSDEFSGSIPPGGMALLCGNRGSGGVNTWAASAVGVYAIEAVIDPDNTVDECVESNNVFAAQLAVYSAPLPNLALNKAVAVTSVEGPGLEGNCAVDGNMGTRWASLYTDPQAITVDLGGMYHIDDITLYWESAFAREYYIKVADGSGPWRDAYHETNGQGGVEKIAVSTNARKLMVLGAQRATQFGYSIYEIQVHGSIATAIEEKGGADEFPRESSLAQNYPNPFNPSTEIRYQLSATGFVTLKVFDVLGRQVAVLVNATQQAGGHAVRWDASGLPSGVYVYKLETGSFNATKQMVYLK